MIHRDDERAFRLIEIACYTGFVIFWLLVPVIRDRLSSHFAPGVFVAVSALGLVFMARFFIYAHPERFLDRERAVVISIPPRTRWALGIGTLMCIAMLALGILGLLDPAAMSKVIATHSPFRLVIDSGRDPTVGLFAVLVVGVTTIIIGAFLRIRRLVSLGTTVMLLAILAAATILL